ncbi:profilin [Eremomyces bilateralis CBS 781.70]|uniref:Profilin n=1 Tax=Eremomyces bilateralis CBS 781.70 TaxID=1392243 RepID=A0A6G1G4M1_9PEZI|nr:profilin [Eremomyces bilateralis CBS 781.70]KAF1813035.1 profilin [Eremomyces bilateralis CBS 781.70]
MSWQDYIDKSLIGSKYIDKAAIFAADGSSVWASSPGFVIEPSKEMPEIIKALKEDSGITSLVIQGEKYIIVNTEGSLRLKKGREGLVIAKTNQALLIAHHPDTVQLPNATATVENLADYLKGQGY